MSVAGGRTEYRSIQALRFLAALMVVILHAANRAQSVSPGFSSEGWQFLAGGVDIFFVISGTIMALILTPETRPLDFAWRRFRRVVPLYWVMTLVAVVCGLLWPGLVGPEPTAGYVIKSLLFFPQTTPYLTVGWTLNYEVPFYAAIAVSLLFRKWWLVTVVVGLAVLLPLGHIVRQVDARLYYYAHNAYMIEFLWGIGIAYLSRQGLPKPIIGLALAAIGMALIVMIWGLTSPRGIYTGLPAGLVVYGFLSMEPWFRKGWANSLVWLGATSYSIYLAHKFGLDLLYPRMVEIPIFANNAALSIIVLTMCSTLLGLAVWRFIEVPLIGTISSIKTVPKTTSHAQSA